MKSQFAFLGSSTCLEYVKIKLETISMYSDLNAAPLFPYRMDNIPAVNENNMKNQWIVWYNLPKNVQESEKYEVAESLYKEKLWG